MNGDSTSTRHAARGSYDGGETSRKLKHTPCYGPYQDRDHLREKAEGSAENGLQKSNYGRRRSDSAPDVLLDCLHCGKDLFDLRMGEERSSRRQKNRHSRRYTVASERVWSPAKCTSPLRGSFVQKGGEKNKYDAHESSYQNGRKRIDEQCGETRRHDPRGKCCDFCGDHTTYPDFVDNKMGQASRKNPHEKKSAQRRDERIRTHRTESYPQTFICDDSSVDDSATSHQDSSRSTAYDKKTLKYKEDYNDAATSDDSEAQLTNVNENRRRKSMCRITKKLHKETVGVTRTKKPKRHSYPRGIRKGHSCPVRLDHPVETLYENTKKGRRSTTVRHLVASRAERHCQPPQTSEDEVENDEESEASEIKAHADHCDSLLITNLSEMLRRHRLCDVTLRSNGQEVSAHKLALAAFSEAFASTYCEGGSRDVVIDIPDTSVGAIQEVLRFVYSGGIRLNPDNVGNVLSVATFLHIDHIVQMCRKMLLNPDIETVVFFSSLAEKYRLTEDLAYFYDFMCKHFLRVSRTRGWKTLTFAQVFDLLSENNLNVDRELDVFHAAVAWIDFDRTNRLTFAADLIGCVRFAYITPDEIAKHVETKQFLFQGDEGKELLLCIYRHHALQTCGCQHGQRGHHLPRRQYVALESLTLQDQSNSAYSPRHSLVLPSATISANRSLTHAPSTSDVILAVGGVNPFQPDVEDQARLVAQFHPRHNHWTALTRLPDGRHHHGALLLGGCLYIIGGSILDDLNPEHLCNPTASCYRYDLINKQWGAIAPLNVPRMYHATAILNEVIFVLAGQTQQSRHLSSMECYRPEVGEWETGVDMMEARIGVTVAAYRSQLYAVGGFLETEQEHVVRATVDVFDPKAGSWTSLNDLPSPRCHAEMAECGGKLYLVGGSTFTADSSSVCSLPSVLRYDENEDRWDRIQSLRTPRHDMGVAVLGCRIFIVGGVSSTENKVLSDVECYDVETDYWLDDVEPVRSPVLGLTCVALMADQ